MTKEKITSIEFLEIGTGKYKLQEVTIPHPLNNVHGLTLINGVYYKKVWIRALEIEPINLNFK